MTDKPEDIFFIDFIEKFVNDKDINGAYDKLFENATSLRLNIIGAARSGKSFLVSKILDQIKSKYSSILYFYGSTNESFYSVEGIKYIPIKKHFPRQIKLLFAMQRMCKKGERQKILIVCDDIQAHIKKMKTLFDSLTYCRHLAIDIILICQYFTMLPPLVRNQCTHTILKKVMQENTIEQIYNNMSSFEHSKKKFIKFVRAFQRDFRTLIVDHSNNNEILYDNGTTVL